MGSVLLSLREKRSRPTKSDSCVACSDSPPPLVCDARWLSALDVELGILLVVVDSDREREAWDQSGHQLVVEIKTDTRLFFR